MKPLKKAIASALLIVALTPYATQNRIPEPNIENIPLSRYSSDSHLPIHPTILDSLDIPVKKQLDMGELAGVQFANLFSDYTGITGKVPFNTSIDFTKQLNSMWKKKLNSTPELKGFYEEKIASYDHKETEKMTFPEYLDSIDNIIEETYQNIDWETVRRHKPIGHIPSEVGLKAIPLDPERTGLLKEMAGAISAKDMISYAMTELMPSYDGKKNRAVLEILVEEAGPEFINCIPSLGDDILSFGPYQLTEHVIGESGRYDATGASIISKALPEEMQIPTELEDIQGDDHHKAAYLLAINNIADALRKVDSGQIRHLNDNWKENLGNIAKYIAIANHHPKDAHRTFRLWIENKAAYDINVSCSDRLLPYVRKTHENREALGPEQRYHDFAKVRDGKETIFSYVVQKGDHPAEIIRKFDYEDQLTGDNYPDLEPGLFTKETYKNLVEDPKSHAYVGDNLQPGQEIYLRVNSNF
ncbi:MAG: hypothetical protein R6V53_00605 [Candidatus Woesearchaeota archaeon]